MFDDVEVPFFNAVHFDIPHAEEIFAWLEKIEDKGDKVYVHCHAGISRSAAVAKFIAELYDIPGGIHVYPHYNQMAYRVLTNYRPDTAMPYELLIERHAEKDLTKLENHYSLRLQQR